MAAIGKYILSVTSAALICCILKTVAGENGLTNTILHLLAGLFLIMTAVSPWVSFDWKSSARLPDSIPAEAENIIASGENIAKQSYRENIKQRTEAYILDKADSLNADLTVSVTLSGENPPVPVEVQLQGNISPYGKRALGDIIRKDLGIGLEAQKWTK